jgi:hypothetical protein
MRKRGGTIDDDDESKYEYKYIRGPDDEGYYVKVKKSADVKATSIATDRSAATDKSAATSAATDRSVATSIATAPHHHYQAPAHQARAHTNAQTMQKKKQENKLQGITKPTHNDPSSGDVGYDSDTDPNNPDQYTGNEHKRRYPRPRKLKPKKKEK